MSLNTAVIGIIALVGVHTMLGKAVAQPFAYVTNPGTGAVTKVDTVHNTATATLPLALGDMRLDAKFSPDGSRLYVADFYSVSVVDTATGTVVDTIQDTVQPAPCDAGTCTGGALDLSPDGALLYVTTVVSHPPLGEQSVTVIDTATDRVVASIPVGVRPHGIVVAANGTAYVTTGGKPYVLTVIDTAARMVTATIPLGLAAYAVAVSPDGQFVYVGTWDEADNRFVAVIDTHSNTVISQIAVEGVVAGLAVTGDGRRIYAATSSGAISVIDTSSNQIIATMHAGRPEGVVVSRDGTFAYVSDYDAGTILVIDTSTNTIIDRIFVGPTPASLALSADGARLCAVAPFNPIAAWIIDTVTRRVTATILGYSTLESVVVRPDGRRAYITNTLTYERAVLVMDTAANVAVASISLEGAGLSTGTSDIRLAVSADSARLYITTDPIAVIDTKTNQITGTIPLGTPVAALALSPEGSTAYALGFDKSVFVIDTETHAVSARVTLTETGISGDIAVTPDGRFLYVALEHPPEPDHGTAPPGNVVVLDAATYQVVATLPGAPSKIAFRPDGRFAYVATDTDGVAVIDTTLYATVASLDVGLQPRRLAVTADGTFVYAIGYDSTVTIIDAAKNQVAGSLYVGGFTADIATGVIMGRDCPSDCNADGQVTVDELLTGVAIALGSVKLNACPAADVDASGHVTVDDLLASVDASLNGCSVPGLAPKVATNLRW